VCGLWSSPWCVDRSAAGLLDPAWVVVCWTGVVLVSWDPAGWPGGDRLSRCLSSSTMGAEVFHGRVRDGIGCCNLAMTTGPPGRILGCWVLVELCVCVGLARLGAACGVLFGGGLRCVGDGSSIGRLVTLGCTGYPASTCVLLTCWSGTALEGDLVWRGVSCLDAFSSYPVRTWLPSCATGVTTGAPEVRPSRSSRTRDRSSQVSYTHGR
jgi:hypothetical protein